MKRTVKIISLPILGLLLTLNLSAQTGWTWSRHFNTSKASIITGLASDDLMNLYVTGQFKADVDLGGTVPMPLLGTNTDLFMAKYDSSGAFLDSLHFYCLDGGGKAKSNNVTIDRNNDIIITGMYDGTVAGDLNLGYPQNGLTNSFIAKFDGGTLDSVWSDTLYGPDHVKAQFVTTDPLGNIYVTGFSSSTIFVGDSVFNNPYGGEHSFVAKYNTNGTFQWATQIPTSGADSKFLGVDVPNENEIYIGGYYTGSIYLNGTELSTTDQLYNNGIIIKLDGDGNIDWGRVINSSGSDRCNGVAADANGDIYATGYFSKTAVFDSSSNGSQDSGPIVSTGNYDIFVAKYNSSGRLLWKQKNGSKGNDIGYGAIVSNNLVQFAGYFSDTLRFNYDTIGTTGLTDQDAAFFVYDKDGNAITGASVQGTGADKSELLAYDEQGENYMGVVFQSDPLVIGDSTYINGAGSGKNNAALAKHKLKFSAAWTNVKNATCNSGSDGQLSVAGYFGEAPYSYSWSGPVDPGNTASATNLPAGSYQVTITDNQSRTAKTSILNLTAPAAITVLTDSTNVSCNGLSDGTISVTNTTGGTAPYNYAWSGPSGDDPTNPDQSGLIAGTYTLEITDSKGCTGIETVEITEPEPIYFGQVVIADEDPAGSSSGSIDLDVTGGTPTYTYAWVNSSTSDSLIGRVNER